MESITREELEAFESLGIGIVPGRRMTTSAPWPAELEELVGALSYKPGWQFELCEPVRTGGACRGLALRIFATNPDTFDPVAGRNVSHYFPVPAAVWVRSVWKRWLFDRILDVERHETMEFFKIGDVRPFAPNHTDAGDPYAVADRGIG